MKETMPLSHAE